MQHKSCIAFYIDHSQRKVREIPSDLCIYILDSCNYIDIFFNKNLEILNIYSNL